MLRRSLVLASLLALAACGGNVVVDNGGTGNGGGSTQSGGGTVNGDVCEQAKAHLKTCGGPSNLITGTCQSSVECYAHCVLAVGCGAFDGTDPTAASQFSQCLSACLSTP